MRKSRTESVHVLLTSNDMRRLAVRKNEIKTHSNGYFEIPMSELIQMLAKLTIYDISKFDFPETRYKFGKAWTALHRKNVVHSYESLREIVGKYDPDAGKKLARFIPHMMPAQQTAREYGAGKRTILRWINRANRPSKGVRKHVRNQKAAQRRAK